MARRMPAQHLPATRVVHYVDPAMQADLSQYALGQLNPAALIAQQQRNTELYLRWKARQADIAARDRKVRGVFQGLGAFIGLVVLALAATAGWLLWTFVGLGILAVPVLLGITAALAVGGHRCITIVQHWH